MGFEVPVPVYVLSFDEKTRWNGLIVKMESAPIGVLFDAARLGEQIRAEANQMKQLSLVETLLNAIGGCLVSWNVERKGIAVPATLEGLRGQPLDMVLEIVQSWTKAVAEVPVPLVRPSTNGSPLAALPVETLSPAPANS